MNDEKVNYRRVGLAVAAILIVAAYFWGPGMVQKRAMDSGKLWLSENKEIIEKVFDGTEIKAQVTTRKDILIMGYVKTEEDKKVIQEKLNKLKPPIPFRIKINIKKVEPEDGE